MFKLTAVVPVSYTHFAKNSIAKYVLDTELLQWRLYNENKSCSGAIDWCFWSGIPLVSITLYPPELISN